MDLLGPAKRDSICEVIVEGTKKKIEDISVVYSSGIRRYYQVKTKEPPANWKKEEVINILHNFGCDKTDKSDEFFFISDGNPSKYCVQLCDLINKLKESQRISESDNQMIQELQNRLGYSLEQTIDLLKKTTIDLQKGKVETLENSVIYKAGMFLQITDEKKLEALIKCILAEVYRTTALRYSWKRKFDKTKIDNLVKKYLPTPPTEKRIRVEIKSDYLYLYVNGEAPTVEPIVIAAIRASKTPSKYTGFIKHTSEISNLHKRDEYGKTESLKELVKPIESQYLDGIAPAAQTIGVADFALLCQTYLLLGDAKFHNGRFTDAELDYKKAYKFALYSREKKLIEVSLYELGAAIGMQMKHTEALSCFKELLKMNAANALGWFNTGVAYSFLEKYQDAVDSYLKVIEFGTKASDWGTVASAYYNMGNAQQKLKKYQDAVDSYLKAIDGRSYLSDRGERIFPTITLLVCILGTKNIRAKNHDQAKGFAEVLVNV